MEDKGLNILIIEDDPALARMYAEKFRIEGFKPIIARDGASGLDFALKNHPNFILLDILLPGENGLSILAKLRRDPQGRNIPVIALSNLAERSEANEAIKLGVKEYLAKAMHSPEDVVEKVKMHIGPSN